MPDIPALIQSGTASVWLLLPVAIVLGALHALEPGHSKSMMTAFIVAIHGTAAPAGVLAPPAAATPQPPLITGPGHLITTITAWLRTVISNTSTPTRVWTRMRTRPRTPRSS